MALEQKRPGAEWPCSPAPDRLPHVLHGEHNLRVLGVSFVTTLVGLFWFARRDV